MTKQDTSSRSPCLGAYSVGKLRREVHGSVLVLARQEGGGFAGAHLCLELECGVWVWRGCGCSKLAAAVVVGISKK